MLIAWRDASLYLATGEVAEDLHSIIDAPTIRVNPIVTYIMKKREV